ncbi:hypothetical protein ABPG74_004447 [Tetrahymena malaccensis]
MHTNDSSRMTSNFSNTSRVKHKIIFLGDQHVGKTCIIERFMYDVFDEKPHPTVGVDFLAKTLHIDDKSIRLSLWDTAGQERFRSLIPSYLRDATCAVIVFDVTNKESFSNVDRWIKDYKDNRGSEAPCVLVANKIDLKLTREVQLADLEKKAKENNMKFYEISAKTGENVANMFKDMAISLQPVENSILSPNADNLNNQKKDYQFANQNKQPSTGNTGAPNQPATKPNTQQPQANQNFTLKNDKPLLNGQNQQNSGNTGGSGKCC